MTASANAACSLRCLHVLAVGVAARCMHIGGPRPSSKSAQRHLAEAACGARLHWSILLDTFLWNREEEDADVHAIRHSASGVGAFS